MSWNNQRLTNKLKFSQVKKMFGDTNSRELLLPIVFDLANLVRQGYFKADKHKQPNQFLRRSFVAEPKAFKKTPTKEVEFKAPLNFMRDDSLFVDEDDGHVRDESGENFDEIKPEALVVHNSSRFSTTEKMPFKLPAMQSNQFSMKVNLSMEEKENLALSALNGSFHEAFKDVNGSDITAMPLIGRYRKKNQPPLRSGPFPEHCERFTGGLCINVKNYPMGEIMGSIKRHRHAMEALLAEYRDKNAEIEELDYLGDPTSDLSDLR
jgi:hypothetical protein